MIELDRDYEKSENIEYLKGLICDYISEIDVLYMLVEDIQLRTDIILKMTDEQ